MVGWVERQNSYDANPYVPVCESLTIALAAAPPNVSEQDVDQFRRVFRIRDGDGRWSKRRRAWCQLCDPFSCRIRESSGPFARSASDLHVDGITRRRKADERRIFGLQNHVRGYYAVELDSLRRWSEEQGGEEHNTAHF